MTAAQQKPAKLAIQSPSQKIIRLTRKQEYGTRAVEEMDAGLTTAWETVIKIGEKGTWRGLVLADEEVVRWVLADVRDWQGESEGVRVVFDAVHEAAFAGVDFEHGLAVVAWWHCFDSKTFPTSGPFCLCECWFADDFAGLEEVAVSIACKCATFSLGHYLDVLRNVEMEVCHFKVLKVKAAGVIIAKLDIVAEVGWARDWKMHQCLMIHRRNNMLLLRKKRHMCVADLRGSGEEVPVLSNLRAGAAVQAALGVSWTSQRTIHDSPFAINYHSVPPMIRTGNALHVQDLTGAFEIAANDL
jgi:hypothetical protein